MTPQVPATSKTGKLRARRTALYRLYDASGQLLYVGIAANLEVRWRAHAKQQSWWPEVARKQIEWHPDRFEAAAAEVRAIDTEGPLHNVSRGIAARPDGPLGGKTSVYLNEELATRVAASGLSLGELVRRGLDASEPESVEATLRRVIREELDAKLGAPQAPDTLGWPQD